MAKAISSIAIAIAMNLALCLLIFSISVESRTFSRGFVGAEASLQCNRVHGVKSGDTCFDLAQTFKLSTQHFNILNPNLNCSNLFVGQWLCINGFLN